MLSSLLVLALAVVAPSVHATVFITAPTASSTLQASQAFTITWQDDGITPNLTAFGASSIGLYVGNQIQQTLLQTVIASVNVATQNSQTFTPDPSVGADSNGYFIRFTSLSLASPNGTGNAEAFSAKFTITGMTGTFNSTVAAQMSGTVPPGSSTPSSGSSTGLTSPSTSKPLTATSVKSSSSPSSSSTTSSNGAGRMVVPSVICASGVAAIAFALFI